MKGDIFHDPLFLSALKKGGAGGSASGDIVTFTGDGSPLRSLRLSIDPAQDLHGYDSPWPAGGGKNLLNWTNASTTIRGVTFTVNSDGSIIVNGTADDGDASFYSSTPSDLPFTAGSYILSGCPSGGSSTTYFLNETSGSAAQDVGNGATIVLNEGRNIRIRIVVRDGVTVNNLVFWPMIRLSSISDATFAPYSNLCPISGWSAANLWRTGKNLLDTSGSTTTASMYFIGASNANEFPYYLKAGTYTLSEKWAEGKSGYAYWRLLGTSNNNIIHISGFSSGTFTLPQDGYYRFWYYGNNMTIDSVSDIQLELSSTPTAYAPYSGNQYIIQLGQTIYGGYIQVAEDGSAELVADREYITLSGDDWAEPGDADILTTVDAVLNDRYREAESGSAARIIHGISNYYATDSTGRLDNAEIRSNGVSSNKLQLVNYKDYFNVSSFAEFQAILNATPLQLVYELATPITIPLTPQEISTLAGQNVMWADCGKVDVEWDGGKGFGKDAMLAWVMHR